MPIAGGARWDGRVVGPVAEPTFLGHGRGQRLRYGSLSWDLVEGDVVFSPSELSLTHTRARRGSMETEFDASLQLTRWRFRPNNSWSADANLEQASLQDMQYLLGASYPVHGRLTGQFHGRGTRAQPAVSGLFDLSEADAYGIAFNRLRGQINWAPEEVRIVKAYGDEAENLMTALHEVIGHGSGKLSPKLTHEPQFYLKEYYSTLEASLAQRVTVSLTVTPPSISSERRSRSKISRSSI